MDCILPLARLRICLYFDRRHFLTITAVIIIAAMMMQIGNKTANNILEVLCEGASVVSSSATTFAINKI